MNYSSAWFKSEEDRIRPGDTVVVPLDAQRMRPLPMWTAEREKSVAGKTPRPVKAIQPLREEELVLYSAKPERKRGVAKAAGPAPGPDRLGGALAGYPSRARCRSPSSREPSSR